MTSEFPIVSPYWQGETCCMCNGTGRDASYVTEPDGIFQRVVGRVENGRACRACAGHGKDPSDDPPPRDRDAFQLGGPVAVPGEPESKGCSRPGDDRA